MASDIRLDEDLVTIERASLRVERTIFADSITSNGNVRLKGDYILASWEGQDHFIRLRDLYALVQRFNDVLVRIESDDGEGISVPSLTIQEFLKIPAVGGGSVWEGIDVGDELRRLRKEVRELRHKVGELAGDS